MTQRPARKPKLYLVAKLKLFTIIALKLRLRDKNGLLKFSELIGNISLINKKNALPLFQSLRLP
jgi:hypothetical protein